ncbi:hypothetical protein BDQ94DRAFT_89638 [Aspergillus welwitschiae]|uniref:Uncharacterized protein n=1 Tax=Aspergillus welwitschiae TaxID=1341132 RepID=A0A3F3QFF1_9EURO|nr:hypothetical protein BDQ94DRAFT_89638 [Aspergillus welwitschiae]RDH37386.1 hypothetical protein BDQ94DRAFT_89638 [Aspergillus welwitschiae]
MENGANREKGEFKAQGETKRPRNPSWKLHEKGENRHPSDLTDRTRSAWKSRVNQVWLGSKLCPRRLFHGKMRTNQRPRPEKTRRKGGGKKEEKEKKVSDRATFELGIVAAATEQQQAAGLPYSIVGSEPAPNPPGLNR